MLENLDLGNFRSNSPANLDAQTDGANFSEPFPKEGLWPRLP